MGREIRRVIPNWEHPKQDRPNYRTGRMESHYKPMFDEGYGEVMREWIKNHQLWEKGKHPDQKDPDNKEVRYYADCNGDAPRSDEYRPDWKDGEATWWQVYETVSEGTPVTPPFATQAELVDYLVANGDFWDQSRRAEGNSFMSCEPWKRDQAERFVYGTGWSPSLIAANGVVMPGHMYNPSPDVGDA